MVPAMAEEQHGPRDSQAEPPSSRRRRPRVAILLAFLGSFVLLIFLFREVLFPFLLAIYVAYLVEPIVRWTTRSRLFGIKWTRGPTIVAIYVLVLGGIGLLGWIGIAKLATTVRRASQDMAASLEEVGHRAAFAVERPKAAAGRQKILEQDVLIPRGTRIRLADGLHETLYAVRIEPDESRASVLLDHEGAHDESMHVGRGDPASFVEAALTYGDGTPLGPEDALGVSVTAGAAPTGLEYFAERKLIGPIVRNLADWGYHVEPDLVREFIRIKAEALKQDLPGRLGKGAVSVAGTLVLSIYMFFLILMLTAFIVMDRKGIAQFFASLPPPRYQSAYRSLITYVDDGLAGVIRGQLVICAVNGLLTYLGMLILGVPYALLLATVAGVLSLIPVFGTIVSSIPIVLIALTDGVDTGVLALAWIVLIHVLEANLLNPLIMGSHARMHPVIIIFALLAGEHSFGIWGALLAVPTASIIQSCFRFYLHEIEGLPQPPQNGHGDWVGHLWRKIKTAWRRDAPPEATS
jgi:predicted PurR-regulated permease PerM